MQIRFCIKQVHRDQKGSTLILVLVCMAFLAILGSALLTATVANHKMKTVSELSVNNFYDAESALDEIKIGLEESAEGYMKEAYAYMLQRYSVTPESQRTELLKRKFMNLMYGALTNHADINNASLSDLNLLSRYLVTAHEGTTEFVNSDKIIITKDLSKFTVSVTNLSICYTDIKGYQSTITTDIVISALNPAVSIKPEATAPAYTGYCVLADQLLSNSSFISSIHGSVYAGEGITASGPNASLVFSSEHILSRGMIKVEDKAAISIEAIWEDGALKNEVWASDLETSSSLSTSEHKTYFNVYANTYISDDMTLNAPYGDVILRGNYYGYQTGTQENGPVNSSSISINGQQANLNLSEISELWLAGVNFLSIPSLYGSGSETQDRTYESVMTGEAISFKGDQIAYLVPGSCLVGIGHNPMTKADYERLTEGADAFCYLDLSEELAVGITLSNYVNLTKPYQARYVRYLYESGSTEPLVYLYLNFRDPSAAAQYFTDYQSLNKDRLDSLASSMQLGQVLLGDDAKISKIVNAGTLLTYGESTGLSFFGPGEYLGETITYNSTMIESKESSLLSKYNGLISYLNEDYSGSGITSSLVKSLIRYEDDMANGIKGLKTLSKEAYQKTGSYVLYESGTTDILKPLVIISGQTTPLNLTLSQDRFGLIITDGDVTISSGTFHGLIVTTKNVILDNQANLSADRSKLNQLITKIIKEHPELSSLFFDTFVSSEEEETTAFNEKTIDVTYQNWHEE